MPSVSDSVGGQETITCPHGISSFCMLDTDMLTPAFESFVTKDGILNVASLGTSIHGLARFDKIRDYTDTLSMGLTTQPFTVPITRSNQVRLQVIRGGKSILMYLSLCLFMTKLLVADSQISRSNLAVRHG